MERLRQACTRIAIFIKKLKKERAGRLRESLGKIREGSGIINPLLRLPAHPITILLSPRPPPHLTPFLTSSSNPNLGEVGMTDRAGRLGEMEAAEGEGGGRLSEKGGASTSATRRAWRGGERHQTRARRVQSSSRATDFS